jgi:hypothetical protein
MLQIDDYDALLIIVSTIKSNKDFEKKLLNLHLLAIDEYAPKLGFNSRNLSDRLGEFLASLTEADLRQIKFLFEQSPSIAVQIFGARKMGINDHVFESRQTMK